MFRKYIFISVAVMTFISLPFFIQAQSSDLGNWLIYFGNKKVNSRFNIHHEVQYRNYNAIGDLEQLLLRAGLGYNLTENNNNILLGYGFISSDNLIDGGPDQITANEHRIYQQFITRQKFGRFSWQHRYRFEQRWVASDFRLRFRYFLSGNIALNNKTLQDNTWYASVYNEIFLNSKDNVFDRNRLYTGAGYRLSSALRFELGYMNQFLSQGIRDQVNMIVFFQF